MKVEVNGRVERVTRVKDLFLTVVRTPAPSAYDHPDVFELRSRKSIGRQGDEVKVACTIHGFPGRKFDYTDDQTGEVRQGQNMVVHLNVEEAA